MLLHTDCRCTAVPGHERPAAKEGVGGGVLRVQHRGLCMRSNGESGSRVHGARLHHAEAHLVQPCTMAAIYVRLREQLHCCLVDGNTSSANNSSPRRAAPCTI